MNAIVSIGRNIGPTPMGDAQWKLFQLNVEQLMMNACSFIPFAGTGKGIYNGNDEESYTIVGVLISDEGGGSDYYLGNLRIGLRLLAKQYGQESIALTVGEVEFVSSKPSEAKCTGYCHGGDGPCNCNA